MMIEAPQDDPQTILRQGAAALGVPLDPLLENQLLDLAERLLLRNQSLNLTAARDLTTLIADHLLDSLALVPFLRERATTAANARPRLVDIGTGGGFPALPIAIVGQAFEVIAIESVAKKARAIADVARALGLERFRMLNERAETVGQDPEWRESADFATARGVGQLAAAAELALPLLRLGGVFLAQKGPDPQAEIDEAAYAIDLLGGCVAGMAPAGLERPTGRRTVVRIEKIRRTPNRFPRKPGTPAKQPLREP